LSAPVNAPFSCPNNSLSNNSVGIAAQLTEINGPFLPDAACIPFATSSFPEPVGPKISAELPVGATTAINRLNSLAGADIPEISFVIELGTVSFLEISFVINLSTTESQQHNVRILTVNANKK